MIIKSAQPVKKNGVTYDVHKLQNACSRF